MSQGTGAFSPRAMLILVLVGAFALGAFVVLQTYQPSGRVGGDHALSPGATGFAGVVALLKAAKVPVVISRTGPSDAVEGLLVLTPETASDPKAVEAFAKGERTTLIVLPKWSTAPQPLHRGWVLRQGLASPRAVLRPLARIDAGLALRRRASPARPGLKGARSDAEAFPPAGTIPSLQTVSGKDWRPLVIDDQGQGVVIQSVKHPHLFILTDPDFINTQGLKQIDAARVALPLLTNGIEDQTVVFDVTLNGFGSDASLLKLALEPPFLGVTLCLLAAVLMAGVQAFARFGPHDRESRAFALGAAALVDNSAGLVRMARKEHTLAPAYVDLIEAATARATGADRDRRGPVAERLDTLAARRGLTPLADLRLQAARAGGRQQLLDLGRRLHRWKLEMTRDPT